MRRVLLLIASAALALPMAACEDDPARRPVPAALAPEAKVPGYDLIRFWGDADTAAFDQAMKLQFTQLKAAAESGKLPEADKKAKIVAISGGGDMGAFAAGYMNGWTDSGTRPRFDVVTGVSTGALAAPFVFLGPGHDDQLEQVYTNSDADKVYDARWDFGIIGNAVKDTGPLRTMIKRFSSEAFLDEIAAQYRLGRRLLVSTTDLDTQRPVIWDLSAIAASGRPDRRDLFTDIMLATSAVPGIFPPVKIHVTSADGRSWDELHADGSVAMQMFFLPPGIKLTETEQEVFGHKRDRTLFVLRNGKLSPEYEATPEKAATILQRGVATLVKYQVVYNLRLLQKAAKDSETRFKFMGIPSTFADKPKEKFDRAYAMKLFDAARRSGQRMEWLDDVPETPELFTDPPGEKRAAR